jgi:hypothetical protein
MAYNFKATLKTFEQIQAVKKFITMQQYQREAFDQVYNLQT